MPQADFVEISIVPRWMGTVKHTRLRIAIRRSLSISRRGVRLIGGATRPMLPPPIDHLQSRGSSTRTLMALKNGEGTDDHNRR